MRLVKLAIISLVFLFLLITGISFFFPSHVRISKAVNLKAAKDSVLTLVSDASRWKGWFPGLDSSQLLVENGRAYGIRQHGADSGHPMQIVITRMGVNEIEAEMTNRRLQPVKMGWKLISYPGIDSITLQWYMDFHLRWYPWEKFGSMMLEGSYGSRMEKGLSNIRRLVQQ